MTVARTEDRVGGTTFMTPADRQIVATRVADAPRKLVFEAWTNPEHLPHWLLGPNGWIMPVCESDLRAGGSWHYGRRRPDGMELEMRGVYREIAPPERLVTTESWGGDWPETLNILVLTEESGKTTMTCTVLYPSRQARDAALATRMKEGWSASYDRLDEYYANSRKRRRKLDQPALDWKCSSARYDLLDPPRQYPPLPTIHSLPAEWLNAID